MKGREILVTLPLFRDQVWMWRRREERYIFVSESREGWSDAGGRKAVLYKGVFLT